MKEALLRYRFSQVDDIVPTCTMNLRFALRRYNSRSIDAIVAEEFNCVVYN